MKLVSVIRDSESGYPEQTSQIALTSDLPRRKDQTSGEYNSSLCGQNDGGVDGCLEFEGSHCVRITYFDNMMAVQVAEREATIHQYADEVRATKRYN